MGDTPGPTPAEAYPRLDSCPRCAKRTMHVRKGECAECATGGHAWHHRAQGGLFLVLSAPLFLMGAIVLFFTGRLVEVKPEERWTDRRGRVHEPMRKEAPMWIGMGLVAGGLLVAAKGLHGVVLGRDPAEVDVSARRRRGA